MDAKTRNAAGDWKAVLEDVEAGRGLLQEIERAARENTQPVRIAFGTSGWRGEIGTDFTCRNVDVVSRAVLELLRTDDEALRRALGAADFEEVRRRGVVVGHDNRFLGADFARIAMNILGSAGVRVYAAGEATTPELSAALDRLHAVCSINITSSHNPPNYNGFKFNPSDGGPAGPELTTAIEEIANRLMKEPTGPPAEAPAGPESIDPVALYEAFVEARGTVDLEGIREFVRTADCIVAVDHVHGATRGRPARLLGGSDRIVALRTEDDPLFGGIAPEPSAANMRGLFEVLRASSARFRLGALMDPDGDRIRLTDGVRDITMNHFGAMVLHYLHHHKNIGGVLVKSVATSNFGTAVARGLGVPVRECPVGFKNFRPFMRPDAAERAIVSYEESDGISGFNGTLEKDATFGLLIALEMMAATGKNLSEYLEELEAEYGRYHPERSGVAVDRSMVGPALAGRLATIRERYPVGSRIDVGGVEKTVSEIITLDGTKIVFEDRSWLLIRPSGTEPKVRFYTETLSAQESGAMAAAAERLTREALDGPG